MHPTSQTPDKQPFTPKVKLTRRQQIFVKEYTDNGGNGTQAAMKAYNIGEKHGTDKPEATAAAMAAQNLKKANIQSALENYNELVESTLINTIKDFGTSDKPRQREIAVDVAKFVHDKVHGKATQTINATSTSVTLNIDLTSATGSDTQA